MKVLIINSVFGVGSTGRICLGIADEYIKNNHQVKVAYGRSSLIGEKYKPIMYHIGNELYVRCNVLKARILDNEGLNAKLSTKSFLKWADKYNPDLLWIHNIHGYYLNYDLLFRWIKERPNMKVRWTLHDCWAFTGHCTNFQIAKCDKWKKGCNHCPQKHMYPCGMFLDSSKSNYSKKKSAFSNVNNLEIITPSVWLSGLVQQSFLKDYSVSVVNNTIDKNIFKPTESDFKEKYDLVNKKIVLAVANVWDYRKGFNDIISLSRLLDDRFRLVIVGVNKRQKKHLPNNIIGITRTSNARELATIYTAADVFINLTYEDNYPTTNLEAQACGTPCITYDTGGSPESVPMENVIPCGNIDDVYKKIQIITQ